MKIGKIKVKLRSKEIKALKVLIAVEIIGTALVAAVGYQVASKIAEMASTVSTIALVSLAVATVLTWAKRRVYATMFYTIHLGFYIGLSVVNFHSPISFILDVICALLSLMIIVVNFRIMFYVIYGNAIKNAERYYEEQGSNISS